MSTTTARANEISELRQNQHYTKRPVVEALEQIIYEPITLLDHGFIRLIDYMGDDNAIVQAARVSYGKGTKQVNHDRGLIRYLMRHWHTTPFEMCEIKFHIKLPIFVARQWIRHRTANVNEYSARYSILSKEFYLPQPENMAAQSQHNNQGRGSVLEPQEAAAVLELLKADAEQCYAHYMEIMNREDGSDQLLNENKQGLTRELARMNLPINFYTEWYWKVDLNNLLHFLRLRCDSHAQYEIRVYANAILDIVKLWLPFTYEAFIDYRLNAVNLSAQMKEIVKRMINGEKVNQETSGMSKREWDELLATMGLSQ